MKKQSSLKEALGLEKHDTIVAVGAGGKTTFCLALCDELKNENKVFRLKQSTTAIKNHYG